MKPKRVNFTLHVYGTTNRHWLEWAESIARSLQAELNGYAVEFEFPADITVEVEDGGEGG